MRPTLHAGDIEKATKGKRMREITRVPASLLIFHSLYIDVEKFICDFAQLTIPEKIPR